MAKYTIDKNAIKLKNLPRYKVGIYPKCTILAIVIANAEGKYT